ncbi:MAG: winged helix-turn-helix domain-containing protein [Caulobacteraceae bacterium]
MNDAIAAIALGRRIDLTREADFLVGGARIRPTACEVVAGGRRVRLQPRVMQVLVALARAGGEPVSREALVEVCWGAVALSDDALNRCIQRLRRLAETDIGGAFAVETIPPHRLPSDVKFSDQRGGRLGRGFEVPFSSSARVGTDGSCGPIRSPAAGAPL